MIDEHGAAGETVASRWLRLLPLAWPLALFALPVALRPFPVAGQGSSVYVQGACASARGGAAVAEPCLDASSIYYNPAALAVMPSAASAGFAAIRVAGDFTYDSTGTVVERPVDTPVVPHLYGSYRLGDRLAVGFGAWAPYGLGVEWRDDFEGRFISRRSRLQGLYLQPTVAYRLVPGRLSIGGGVDVVLGSLELLRHLDAPLLSTQLAQLGVPLGTDVARARLAGSGTGITGHLGLLYEMNDRMRLGARYLHAARIGFTGDADFEAVDPGLTLLVPDPATGDLVPVALADLVAPQFAPGAPLSDQGVATELTLPPQLVLGLAVDVSHGVTIAADYQWMGWSSFDELRADFEHGESLVIPLEYMDTHTFRAGADWAVAEGLELRTGFIHNTAASPPQSVTPVLPEAERNLYTVGLGYRVGPFVADAYYNYVDQADRRGRVRSALPGRVILDATDLNTGVYSSTGHILGLTLTYSPGAGR